MRERAGMAGPCGSPPGDAGAWPRNQGSSPDAAPGAAG